MLGGRVPSSRIRPLPKISAQRGIEAAIGHDEALAYRLLRSETLALGGLLLRTHPDVSVEGPCSALSLKNSPHENSD